MPLTRGFSEHHSGACGARLHLRWRTLEAGRPAFAVPRHAQLSSTISTRPHVPRGLCEQLHMAFKSHILLETRRSHGCGGPGFAKR